MARDLEAQRAMNSEQLAQRVIARFHLKALSAKETEHYIRHRLSVAGMTRSIPFDRDAIQRIHEIARGVPRRINLLCDRAMLGAYAHGRQTIDAPMVEKAAKEVFGKSEGSAPDRSGVGRGLGAGLTVAAGLGLAVLIAFAAYGGWRMFKGPERQAAAASAAPSASASASASDSSSAVSRTAVPAASAAASGASSAGTTAAAASTARAASGSASAAASAAKRGALVDIAPPASGTASQAALASAPEAAAPLKAMARAERDEGGRIGTILLVGLGESTALLQAEGKKAAVPLPSLAGEAPPVGRQAMDAAPGANVARFQSAHGLNPIGKVGPTTFMPLNRRAGIDEPRLGDAGPGQ